MITAFEVSDQQGQIVLVSLPYIWWLVHKSEYKEVKEESQKPTKS